MRRAGVSVALVAAAVALVVAGCGGGSESSPGGSDVAASGAAVARSRGCVACHSVNGTASVGPTWKGLAGQEVALADGTVVIADTAYLGESITAPDAKRVRGFSVTMPRLAVTEAEVAALVAYIETLR